LESLLHDPKLQNSTLLGLPESDSNTTAVLAAIGQQSTSSNSSETATTPTGNQAASNGSSTASHNHYKEKIKAEVKHLEKKEKSGSQVAVAAALGAILGCAIAACGIVVLVKGGFRPRMPAFLRKRDPQMQKYYRYNEDAFNDDL
jgi:L-lactate utilization protein LutC